VASGHSSVPGRELFLLTQEVYCLPHDNTSSNVEEWMSHSRRTLPFRESRPPSANQHARACCSASWMAVPEEVWNLRCSPGHSVNHKCPSTSP